MPQKCEQLFKYGHETLSNSRPLSGGLAEYCVLTADTPALALPETLPDKAACIANCATATVAGAFRVGGDCRGQSVLIFGAGMLGLNAAAMARHRGADQVFVGRCRPRSTNSSGAFRSYYVHSVRGRRRETCRGGAAADRRPRR